MPVVENRLDTYTSPPTNYVQLLASLRHAGDLHRLSHLVTQYSNRFDAVHVAAALTRLPKLVQYRPKDMVHTGVVAPQGSGLRAQVPLPGAQPREGHIAQAKELSATLLAMLPEHAARFFPRQVTCHGLHAVHALIFPPLKVSMQLGAAIIE